MRRILGFILLFICVFAPLFSQDIPVSLKNEALYSFVDELADEGFIQLNQVVKPYTIGQVNAWVEEAGLSFDSMNRRQQKEWLFYADNMLWQREDSTLLSNRIDIASGKSATISLAPLGVFHHSEDVYFSGSPILNAQFLNNTTGTYYHRSVGLDLQLQAKNFNLYANVQEYAEKERLDAPAYLQNRTGGNYKNLDYSEMRGGVSYANNWFSSGIVKDYLEWGTNMHGANIISDRAPAFTQFRLKVKPLSWFEFNYVHGWLVSNVIDSAESFTQSNGIRRDVMHGKFLAANMFTIYPFRGMDLSFGNSVVYGADNAKLPYLNPLMFYKSVDHTYNSTDGAGRNVGQNSQMFFDLSYNGIKHCFFYYSLFVDELKIERWKNEDEHNFYSSKAGVRFSNLIPNTQFGLEYTKTMPITYQHDIEVTTFTSNGYYLGHYLRDNAKEWYAYFDFKPVKNLSLKLDYTLIHKGREYGYIRNASLTKHPFVSSVMYYYQDWNFTARYQLAYNMFFNFSIGKSNAQGFDVTNYLPKALQGEQLNVRFGANIGF